MNEPVKKPRGMAALSPERRKEIASMGGKAAHANGKVPFFKAASPEMRKDIASRGGKATHALGKAHKFTSEEARLALGLRKDRQRD